MRRARRWRGIVHRLPPGTVACDAGSEVRRDSRYASRVGTLENKFSWSNSRAATFDRCPRAYWWQYYGSWGGWERSARGENRDAYVLKNLTTRWAWVGNAVHEAIESTLKRLQNEAAHHHLRFSEGLDIDHEVEALTQRMRDQYAESKRGAYRSNPKRSFGLMEHEYDDPVSRKEWKAASQKARTALRSFFESEIFAEIGASDPAEWLAIENLGQFHLDGVGVWASPDFARSLEAGGGEIYDWKTGAVRLDKNKLQVACYSLYLQEKHGTDPTKILNRLVYLGDEVEVHDFVFTLEDLAEARQEIRESMARMRALLADEEKNVATREAFPLTEDLSHCASCVYRRLCGR